MSDKALLIGINSYEYASDLRGCLNDVAGFANLLTDTFGFQESAIRRLQERDARLDNIQDGLKWLSDGATHGDRIVLFFAGHGSYVTSDDADELVDEVICLQDMDKDDPRSYVVDDQLGEFARTIPDGLLTVVLDCCHSGTGTRALRKTGIPKAKAKLSIKRDERNRSLSTTTTLARGALAAKKSRAKRSADDEPMQLVLARFIPPDAKAVEALAKQGLRALGSGFREAGLNHQLLAAAKATEPAADAFIDGDYHGAFTHFLCRAAGTAGGGTSTANIFDATKRGILDAGFNQTPQLEGPYSQRRLFGGTASESIAGGSSDFDEPTPETGSPTPPDAMAVGVRAPSFEQWMHLQSTFLDISRQLIAAESREVSLAGVKSALAGRPVGEPQRECVVYVHGISRHVAGYSDAWWAALKPHLSREMAKDEVLWSDLVNPRSLEAKVLTAVERRRGATLREEIEDELRKRQDRLNKLSSEGRGRAPPVINMRGDGFSIDDFLRYMLNQSTREQTLRRFDDIVRPRLAAGDTLHIIAHSWGTVVAYEGLRRLDGIALPGRVANLFLLGSALSIGAVQTNLFSRVGDGRRPRHVGRVNNVDAAGDIIGGSISLDFAVDAEHLAVPPVGCALIPFTQLPRNPACAHVSYFKADNRRVQEGIISQAIVNQLS